MAIHVSKHPQANKTVVDDRLPAPSRNDPLGYNHQPFCGVVLPVASATPRRWAEKNDAGVIKSV